MELAKLKHYLERFGPLPEDDWLLFTSRIVTRDFTKKQTILKTGRIEDYVSFIDTGIVRYFAEEREREVTFEIAFESSFATAYDSFLTRTPVHYNAQTLTATRLFSINYEDLQFIYSHTSMGDRFGRLTAEELYIKKTQRQLSLLKDPAEQRYLRLVREHPHLLRHVPLKYLASYIGITPQALSRIRARIR